MKKFDIKKWMEEQKNLPKEKRSLNSKPPIKSPEVKLIFVFVILITGS